MDYEMFRQGELVNLTSGEYSDFGVLSLVRVLRDFDAREVADAYMAEHPEQVRDYNFDTHGFVAWLSAKGYIEDVDCRFLHIGDGGECRLHIPPVGDFTIPGDPEPLPYEEYDVV